MLDTSALRDLHCADILGQIFYLGCDLLTTDIIEQAKELEVLNPVLLKQLGLEVKELSGDLVLEIDLLRAKYPGPSIPDLSALLLARTLGCSLVTRDRLLAAACRAENVAVRDTLWVIRKMVLADRLTDQEAADALEVINTTRLRSPNPEWTTQIRRWRKTRKGES